MRALADLVARWRTPEPRLPREPEEQETCVLCGARTAQQETFARDGVCANCGYHHALSAWARIQLLADPGTFQEMHASTTAVDPLSFPDGGNYRRQLREAFRRTALREAAITGTCQIRGRPALLIVLDFGFLGGSMGVVVGERVARAFEAASKRKLPVVSVISSSGMRVREGLLALTQMAKTAAAAQRHHQRNLAHFAILANPSTGAVFASFANLADVIVGEPGALMGYSALRDIERLEGAPLPADAHSAESHLERGLIDLVVGRSRQRDLLVSLLDLTAPTYRLEITRRLEPFVPRPARTIAPWHEVELARHQNRPTAMDYIGRMTTSFVELRGTRGHGDDANVIVGFADLGGQAVMIVGHQRTDEAQPQPPWLRPEGVRKAARAMRLAEKFSLPLVSLIDTRGALPSREAEEGGIGNAIADNLALMSTLRTPILAVIIGEGGSEAALAFGVADRLLMLEHAIFSIVSPEDAAAALYRDSDRADQVAGALRLTAADARQLQVVDLIVREPSAGAHANHDAAAGMLKTAIVQELGELRRVGPAKLVRRRYDRYRTTPGYQNFFRVSLGRNLTDLRTTLSDRLRQALARRFPRLRRDGDDDTPSIPVD
ncbi:MAG: acetyl-CoA carboxylase carboxyltransferase subunit alpha/beta [Dehalococcoidia bacterium]